jgi:UDP-2,3-diacylglucosamine pyrophosphatase LpxH
MTPHRLTSHDTMSHRPVTLIASDFHMGGGADDRGDDFIHEGAPFERFLDEQRTSDDGRAGRIELILNGDTFELAQVRPDVYTLGSALYWCSRDESLRKLEYVLEGHAGIFDRLRQFVDAGNALTLAAGNHDVELYWPEVQDALRSRLGDIRFELGTDWYERYDGRLALAHGHMADPANRFARWERPIVNAPDGERLEMCPGTLFMVKFVNTLEQQYPFADNIHPVTALAGILGKDRWSSLAGAAWLLARFAARHPASMLEADGTGPANEVHLLQDSFLHDPFRFRELASTYRRAVDNTPTDDALRARIVDPDGLANMFLELMAALPPEQWLPLATARSSTLSLEPGAEGEEGLTLHIFSSGMQQADAVLRTIAEERMEAGASVVVMGHTHQPDTLVTDRGVYFNPGSWTRYLDSARIGLLTVEDLKSEADFPYQLNYVRIEPDGAGGRLLANMHVFEEKVGLRFGQRLNLSGG